MRSAAWSGTHVVRHTGPATPGRVIGPCLGQIQAVGDGQAGVVVGNRQADRDLAVVLLAELATVLPCHADRMRAFLREAGVVDDPGADRPMPLDGGHHLLAHGGQHGLIGPVGLGDEVVQRLVRGLHPTGFHARGHRLDALAIAGKQQSGTV